MRRGNTSDTDRATEIDYDDDDGDTNIGFVGDYVVPEDDVFTQFGDANFGTIGSPFLLSYVTAFA